MESLPTIASNVPGLRVLRAQFGFDDTNRDICKDFKSDVRAFCAKYRFGKEKGSSYHKWDDQRHVNGLRMMSRAFLDVHANNYGPRSFSGDRSRAKSTENQFICVFWRHNINQRTVKKREEAKRRGHHNANNDDNPRAKKKRRGGQLGTQNSEASNRHNTQETTQGPSGFTNSSFIRPDGDQRTSSTSSSPPQFPHQESESPLAVSKPPVSSPSRKRHSRNTREDPERADPNYEVPPLTSAETRTSQYNGGCQSGPISSSVKATWLRGFAGGTRTASGMIKPRQDPSTAAMAEQIENAYSSPPRNNAEVLDSISNSNSNTNNDFGDAALRQDDPYGTTPFQFSPQPYCHLGNSEGPQAPVADMSLQSSRPPETDMSTPIDILDGTREVPEPVMNPRLSPIRESIEDDVRSETARLDYNMIQQPMAPSDDGAGPDPEVQDRSSSTREGEGEGEPSSPQGPQRSDVEAPTSTTSSPTMPTFFHRSTTCPPVAMARLNRTLPMADPNLRQFSVSRHRPEPKIMFVYGLTIQEGRNRRTPDWEPSNGGLIDKSLSDIERELPLGNHSPEVRKPNLKGLHFDLEGPFLEIDLSVKFGDETRFKVFKKRFEKEIQRSLANSQDKIAKGEVLVYTIFITVLCDQTFAERERVLTYNQPVKF